MGLMREPTGARSKLAFPVIPPTDYSTLGIVFTWHGMSNTAMSARNVAKNFKELQAKMSPEQKARADVRYKQIVAEMPLSQLREARSLTQTSLAQILGVHQPAVSKLERQADMYISTLRSFIHAMGGQLRIEAEFPDGRIEVSQFKELVDAEAEKQTATHPKKTRRRGAAPAV
jgi:transcriptional regulator with XRE-family HTH domain